MNEEWKHKTKVSALFFLTDLGDQQVTANFLG
jgi:hypothetical protein